MSTLCQRALEGRSSAAEVLGWGRRPEVASELHVAANGEEGDAVIGVAVAEAEEAVADADGEGFDADAAQFPDDEVAELVDEDEHAEDDSEFDDDEEKMHEERAETLETIGRLEQELLGSG
jgi:hypothetical protein